MWLAPSCAMIITLFFLRFTSFIIYFIYFVLRNQSLDLEQSCILDTKFHVSGFFVKRPWARRCSILVAAWKLWKVYLFGVKCDKNVAFILSVFIWTVALYASHRSYGDSIRILKNLVFYTFNSPRRNMFPIFSLRIKFSLTCLSLLRLYVVVIVLCMFCMFAKMNVASYSVWLVGFHDASKHFVTRLWELVFIELSNPKCPAS